MIYLTLGLASGFGSDLIIFPNIDIVYNSKRIPNGFPEPLGTPLFPASLWWPVLAEDRLWFRCN